MNRRIVWGFATASVVVPTVIVLGGLGLSLVPVLGDGVSPMLRFMAEADGLSGIFFFTYFFATPAALVVALLVYALLGPRGVSRYWTWRWATLVGACVGGVLLPPVWAIARSSSLLVTYVGPVLLGVAAGSASGATFWAVIEGYPPPGTNGGDDDAGTGMR